jgi:cation/acetate symporter
MTTPLAADVKALPLVVFGIVVAITLVITWWASKRTKSAEQFFAAGRSVSGLQNGLAIAGDYMSAAAFLGVTGLMFLYGYDGYLTGVAALVSFIPVMLLLADRMRNSGKYTMADVLAFRLHEGPARTAAAVGTLTVVALYLVAQMIAAGALIEGLTGLKFAIAVVITGGCMLAYVLFGGMLATTWVQIVKAVMLLTAVFVMTVWTLAKFGFDPGTLMQQAGEKSGKGHAFLEPGELFKQPLAAISTGIAFGLGTAGLPHILMRFFTVPSAREARQSVGWATVFIGSFYAMVGIIGFGSIALLGTGAEKAVGDGGNLAAPLLAEYLGGGAGSTGGDIFFAIVSGVAFATILAVVAGLVLAASASVAHDVYLNVIHRDDQEDRNEVWVGKVSAAGIGIAAIGVAIMAGAGFNVQFLVGLAFAIAASCNFPALLLALTWKPFNTAGALTGIALGLISSVTLIVLSPAVWPGPDSEGAPFALSNPAILSVPIGFIGCFLGTYLGHERSARRAHSELRVRSETGLGSEQARPA